MAQTASPSKLDLTKPVQTKDGRKVRLLCTDRVGFERPIIGLVTQADGSEQIHQWLSDGTWLKWKEDSQLVNVPVTVRVCFYRGLGNIVQCRTIYDKSLPTEDQMEKYQDVICFKDIVLDT